jgi:hypothetical protein
MAFEPWRYPGIFNLNQSASLPNSFGPPNMSQQLQSGISALADPIVAKLKEDQARAELAKKAAETLSAFGPQNTPTTTGTTTGTTATPMRTSSTAGSPAGDDTSGTQGAGVAGTSTALLDASRRAIGTVESGGNYSAVGPATKSGDRAYGMFQVMGNNVGPWTEQHFGQRLTPQEFLKNPEAQEAVFRGQFGGYLDQYGNIRDAASKWFSGRPYAEAVRSGASDGYNRVDQYVAKVTQNLDRRLPAPPAPQAAPTASFAPQVAPAPTPAAAASVTAPQGQQQQPQFTAPNVNMNDYTKEIYAALNRGDQAKAREPAAERDMVEAQRKAAQPQQAGGMPLPRRGDAQGGQWPGQQAPGPQSQQQPSPQEQQLAQQQQVIANTAQTAQENDARLEAQRQAGQRTRIASISPELPGLQLGGAMPGAQGGPAAAPPRQPPSQSPAMGEPSFFSPEPTVTPQMAARPQTPTVAPPPAAATAGPTAPPPSAPAVAPPTEAPPVRVAQAQGLPPVVSVPQQRQVQPFTREQARVLLNNATTPEEVNRVAAVIYQQQQAAQQQAAPTPNRFKIENGHWIDTLTGQTKPLSAEDKAAQHAGNFQWNPKTGRYDIPIGGDAAAGVSKEVRSAERELFNDFESTETVKKYRELEQGVQGLKAAFTGGSAGADLVATIQLFKAIDPGSTVTQNEVASVKNAAGVPETLRALFNRGVGEGGQFSPELRAEIFNTAQRLQQARVKQVEQHAQSYRNRAKAYGLDPDRTVAFQPFQFEKAKAADFPDLQRRTEDAAPAGPPRGGPGSARENPMDVPSMAAAEQLAARMPAGSKTFLRLPDGKIWVVD